MEFQVKRNPKNNSYYDEQDQKIAYEFSKKLVREVNDFVKGIILFGSVARRKKTSKNADIDILVIVDDLDLQVNQALVQGYRLIVQKLVTEISTKLHITTLKYTTFWEYIRAGDPVGINMLRDGVALLDTGFFEPLQRLLQLGRIRPTPEAIWAYYAKVQPTIENSKGHLLQGVVDLYWATIDAAHACLMKMGEVPPGPDDVPRLLEEKLVKAGLLNKKYPGIAREFYHVSKNIIHREIQGITGEQYAHYLALAEDFCNEMKKIVEK